MKYNEKRALYYSVMISEIQNDNLSTVFAKIKDIFLIQDSILDNIVSDQQFNTLGSVSTIKMHLRVLSCFPTYDSFGKTNEDEHEALQIKLNAYQVLQGLKNNSTVDVGVLLAENYSKLNCGVLFSLLLYLFSPNSTETYFQVLKRSLSTSEVVDSATCLLSLFEGERKYVLEMLAKKKSLILSDNFIEQLIEFYNKKTNKVGV